MPFRFRTEAESSSDVAGLATQLGYSYSPADPGDVLGLPFRLYRDDRAGWKVSDFVSGEHGGQSAELFVLEHLGEKGQSRGSGIGISTAGPTSLTCAVLGIPADFPPISISRRVGSLVVMQDADEIQFESDEFNRTFRVHSASEKCAFSLIDGQMMEWLIAQPIPFVTIELAGPWWFVAMPRVTPSGWPVLLSLYDTFGEKVPPVALSTFPPRRN